MDGATVQTRIFEVAIAVERLIRVCGYGEAARPPAVVPGRMALTQTAGA